MGDLQDRFDVLDRTPAPDLWGEIEGRRPRSVVTADPTPARRVAIVALASVIAIAAIGFAIRAFDRPDVPAVTPAVPLPANGDLYLGVGGGEAGNTQYEAVSPDGTRRRTLIHVVDQGWPRFEDVSWSPDGSRIAFVSRLQGHAGIYTADLDGSDITRLDVDPTASWPSWSPDGEEIAFSSARADTSLDGCPGGDFAGAGPMCPTDIYVMSADGSGVRRLTTAPDPEFGPVWSPDGVRIAFTHQGEGDGLQTTIDVMNADGSEPTQVAATPLGSDFRPTWSPDGSSLAYASIRNEEWGIYATDLTTGRERGLVTDAAEPVDDPVWSPDGTRIAFVSDYTNLTIMNADGSDPQVILRDRDGVGIDGISWRPASTATPAPLGAVVGDPVQVGPSGQTTAIAVGEGKVWVAYYDASGAGHLAMLDPTSLALLGTRDNVVTPTWETGGGGLAVGAGSVWVTGGTPDGAVLDQIDPVTLGLEREIPLGPGSGADVAVTDEAVWVLTQDSRMGTTLRRIDPSTGDLVSSTPIPGVTGGRRVVPLGENLAVISYRFSGDTLAGLRLTIVDTHGSILVTRDGPWGRSDGQTVPSTNGEGWGILNHDLFRLDPATGERIQTVTLPPGRFDRAVVGAGGVWVVGRETLRVDPTTGAIDRTVRLADDVGWSAVAASEEALYLMSFDGTVTKLVPSP